MGGQLTGYLQGQDITVTFPVAGLGIIDSITYKVVDQDDNEIVPVTPVDTPTGTDDIKVTVPASLNGLSAGTITARSVILYVQSTIDDVAGRQLRRTTYALLSEDRLPVPSGSFQSLIAADLVAHDMIGVEAYIEADDKERTAALMEARNRLVRLRYYWVPEDWQRRVSQHVELTEYWFNSMAQSEWNTMDAQFKTAICRAQVLEAAHLLTHSQDQEFVDAGVTSIRIGESSRTYRATRSAAEKMPLSPRAMKVLGRFLAPAKVARA